jgi:Cellulase (glycosyl hydrolase family 5)
MAQPLRTLTIGLVLGLLLLACLASPGGALTRTGAQTSSTSRVAGVNVMDIAPGSLREVGPTIAQAESLHANVVRTELRWSLLEPSGPGRVDQATLNVVDRLVSDAAAHGIKVIVTVDSTPCWASSAPASILRKCTPGAPGPADAWPPRNAATYAAAVAFLAQRYGDQLAAIEVWNEPDQSNQAYLAGPEKPQHYATILRAAYPAIKQADPSLPVLAGSLVGSNGLFLKALYAAGIKGYYDGLAVHFYNLTLASLRSIHETQLANGDSTPLWLDEFGWSSCWPRFRVQQEQACVTPQIQARNITDVFRSLAHTSYVAAEVIYQLQGSASEDFGAFNARGKRKPAFAALRGALISPFASPSRVALSLARHGNRVLASGSGPVGDFMELEAFQGSVLRYRALFTLDRFDRYAVVLPAVLGTTGLRVRVYQYWAGPGTSAQASV